MEFQSNRCLTRSAVGTTRSSARNGLLCPARQFDRNEPELIDRPSLDAASVRKLLETLERANRRLGGHDLVLHYVRRIVRQTHPKSLNVLDLGTGLADIPRTLVAFGRSQGLPITVTAVDASAKVLEFAREACRDWPEIRLDQQDMLRLPYTPNSFDLVMCSLALHHFEAADAIDILRGIRNIARVGYLVNDLRRNWFSIMATQLLVGTMIGDPVIRHDALSSCRAAFTVDELRSMADEAGLENCRVRRHHFGFRMVLQGMK